MAGQPGTYPDEFRQHAARSSMSGARHVASPTGDCSRLRIGIGVNTGQPSPTPSAEGGRLEFTLVADAST